MMSIKHKKSADKILSAHICHFIAEEERAILRAMKQAAEFMRTYGRGCKPRMINLKNYENRIQ